MRASFSCPWSRVRPWVAALCWAAWPLGASLLPVSAPQAQTTPAAASPLTARHLQAIQQAFARHGIASGRAELDDQGRVMLAGEYADELEVDRAFSLAQVEVGVRWVSPVTPERIRVKEWERKLGGLFARSRVITPPARGDQPPGPVRQRWALVVGVGRFLHGVQPLEFASRDAHSYYQFLVDPTRGRFPRENVILLLDENATRANVSQALEQLRRQAGEDDLVTVYVSSHGSPPDKRGAVNIVTYDTEVKPRERIWHTSVTEEMLRDFVENLRAKRLVMVLDTCYSNGAYRAVPGFLPPGGKSLGAGEGEGWGIGREFGRRVLGAKDLVLETPGRPPAGAQVDRRCGARTGTLGKGADRRQRCGGAVLGVGPAAQQHLHLLLRRRPEPAPGLGAAGLRVRQAPRGQPCQAGEGQRHRPEPAGHGLRAAVGPATGALK
jgi:hypothetical protein